MKVEIRRAGDDRSNDIEIIMATEVIAGSYDHASPLDNHVEVKAPNVSKLGYILGHGDCLTVTEEVGMNEFEFPNCPVCGDPIDYCAGHGHE